MQCIHAADIIGPGLCTPACRHTHRPSHSRGTPCGLLSQLVYHCYLHTPHNCWLILSLSRCMLASTAPGSSPPMPPARQIHTANTRSGRCQAGMCCSGTASWSAPDRDGSQDPGAPSICWPDTQYTSLCSHLKASPSTSPLDTSSRQIGRCRLLSTRDSILCTWCGPDSVNTSGHTCTR